MKNVLAKLAVIDIDPKAFCYYNTIIILVEKKDKPIEVDANEFNDYEMMETVKEWWQMIILFLFPLNVT